MDNNLLTFLVTATVYWSIYSMYRIFFVSDRSTLKHLFRSFAVFSLLSLPLNFNGNVYTVLGNGYGEKGFNSVFSVFQKSGGSAIAVLGSLYQEAADDAIVVGGISFRQVGVKSATVLVGIVLDQESENLAVVVIGILGRQRAKEAMLGAGISGYQKGSDSPLEPSKEHPHTINAGILLGISGYSRGYKVLSGFGLVINQSAENWAGTWASVALYQKAGTNIRNFAIFSNLQNTEPVPPQEAKK